MVYNYQREHTEQNIREHFDFVVDKKNLLVFYFLPHLHTQSTWQLKTEVHHQRIALVLLVVGTFRWDYVMKLHKLCFIH